ncbi:MAG: CCC motif membrane protein [Dokdonia sp.]|jgi:hypothetical protein
MEERKLPNATISLILGIVSFIACCFSSGFGGVILSGIALYLANKDKKAYEANPDGYDNYSQVKTARIIAIIGLILGALIVLLFIGMISYFGGYTEYQEWAAEQMKQAGM